MQLSGSFAEELQYFSGRSCERDSVKSYATSLSQKIRHTSIRTSKRIVIMAQVGPPRRSRVAPLLEIART